MEEAPCCSCGGYFPPNSRQKNPRYCRKAKCKRARKADWQKKKMHSDPEYRVEQKRCQEAWSQNHSDYWKEYREKHPEKAERNRLLQNVRNRKRRGCDNSQEKVDISCPLAEQKMDSSVIAKMDGSNSHEKSDGIRLPGQFWLVPVIAKMDALKVNIYKITHSYT